MIILVVKAENSVVKYAMNCLLKDMERKAKAWFSQNTFNPFTPRSDSNVTSPYGINIF